ncbi:polyamine aminopropyltransferase [Rhodothermus marinus]|uniref:Polyamine aminopropyltransferase n=1 Tax=Rhodothermus marinus (strain ATCC 43812 / DSM 4252 / R-10) TaxID=518766 RepID=D0MDQ4_RHOM4|nr:polyamine aminopropyltransferase [Rhodothermus marinus]ACY49048.1 spermidine synthase [Rhodothermus marinus DSM 4252]
MAEFGAASENEPIWWYETGTDDITLGLRMRLLHRERTPYQLLEIYEHPFFGRVLVLDGNLQTTQGDEFIYHEMLTHVPLLGALPASMNDASVLIIGGGDGGTLREVLRHDWVRRVVMVEIDQVVIERCREFLGFNGNYDDPRVTLIIGDAAQYVAEEAARQRPFDAILVDSTDPVGPGEVLFTPEFIRNAWACLKPGGVFARHLCMPLFDGPIVRDGVARLRQVFPRVEVYQATIFTYVGAQMAFVACTKDGRSVREPQRLLTGRYYNPDVHRAAFALPTWWVTELIDAPAAEAGL